jgi:hypothetical protein
MLLAFMNSTAEFQISKTVSRPLSLDDSLVGAFSALKDVSSLSSRQILLCVDSWFPEDFTPLE